MDITPDIKRYSRNVELPRYESPGPGYYSLVTSSTKRLSIPKGKRWLSEVRVDYEAKPTSYGVAVNEKGRASSMGREVRDFDPIKYSGNNKAILAKGLY